MKIEAFKVVEYTEKRAIFRVIQEGGQVYLAQVNEKGKCAGSRLAEITTDGLRLMKNCETDLPTDEYGRVKCV